MKHLRRQELKQENRESKVNRCEQLQGKSLTYMPQLVKDDCRFYLSTCLSISLSINPPICKLQTPLRTLIAVKFRKGAPPCIKPSKYKPLKLLHKNPPLHRPSEYKPPGAYTWKLPLNTKNKIK